MVIRRRSIFPLRAVDAAVFEDEPHHEARHRAARLVGKQAPRRPRPSTARRAEWAEQSEMMVLFPRDHKTAVPASHGRLPDSGRKPPLLRPEADHSRGCTTRRRNAHRIGNAEGQEVLYRWHPWAGCVVDGVHAVIDKSSGAVLRCSERGSGERWLEL